MLLGRLEFLTVLVYSRQFLAALIIRHMRAGAGIAIAAHAGAQIFLHAQNRRHRNSTIRLAKPIPTQW